jgi:nucleoside-diphosphate-sugar epimerase
MRYFVTGATGFIGGHVARQLIEAGHSVVALVRDPAKASALSALGVELHRGDITDRDSLRVPMTGTDGVFHIAAWYEVGTDSSRAEAINVDGTRNVLETMRDLGIPKGVYTSTLAVFSDTHGRLVDESYSYDGPHISEYDRTKWLAHYRVAKPMMDAGLPLVIVQPGVGYGPGDHSLIRDTLVAYLRGQLPLAPLQTAYCWAHVEDVAQGHLQAMERGKTGESYIIAGERKSLIEALQLAEKLTGVRAPRIHVPPALMRVNATLAGVAEKVLPLPQMYRSETLRASAGVTYIGDNSKARRELGYNPRPLADGLPETLAYEQALLAKPNR